MTGPVRYCGRDFTHDELEVIRELAATLPTRRAIADALCVRLGQRRVDGRLKDMSARVALLRMADNALIVLPPPPNSNGNARHARHLPADTQLSFELSTTMPDTLDALGPIRPVVVDTPAASKQWRTMIATHHYLGYTPFAGAQLRYLIDSDHGPVAALGFAALSLGLRPRDRHIGWDATTRTNRLHLIVGNARFLILPHVRIPNLASHILATITRRLRADWQHAYSYKPVLIETFVETGRFTGTSYQAANWTHVGHTQGRGKLDRDHQHTVPVKDIYLHPLHRRWRPILTTPL